MKKLSWKTIGYIILAVVIIALTVWLAGSCQKINQYRRDKAEIENQLKSAELEKEVLKKEINDKVQLISQLEKRPVKVVVNKPMPADCKTCFENYKLDYRAETALWNYSDPDALDDQPGELNADKLIDQAVQPYIKAVRDCEGKLKPDLQKPFQIRQSVDLLAGYGLEGYSGLVIYSPLELGSSQMKVRPVVFAGMDMGAGWDLNGGVGVMVELNF